MRRLRFSRRHVAIGLISLSAVLVSVIWIFTFPFRPSLVLRVIPPEATAVSWHLKPASRIDALLRSAPVTLLLAGAGVSEEEAKAEVEAPGVQTLLKRLAGTGVTLGFAPAYGQQNTPALFLGSWVGGVTTHLMRGGWLDDAFEGFVVHKIGRERIWSGVVPELPVGMQQVSFGVYEGVLAGCASSDPFAALSLLLKLKRHGPLTALAEPLASLDEGCGHIRSVQHGNAGVVQLWTGSFELAENGRIDGDMRLENADWKLVGDMKLSAFPESSVQLMGPFPAGLPAALMALPLAHAVALAEELLLPGSAERELLDLVGGFARKDGDICVWLAGGELSGRLMRLKVPSIGFALQVDTTAVIADVASQLADQLNSRYGYGLITVPDRHDSNIMVVRSVKDGGGLAFLGADERPALALKDGWLVGMSNVAVLRRLMALDASPDSNAVTQQQLDQVWLYGRTRLPALGELTGNALAGYALVRLLQTGKAERYDTPEVKRILAGMNALGEGVCRVGLDPQGKGALYFTIDGRREDANE